MDQRRAGVEWLGLVAWAVPYVSIDRLGVRMGKELAKAGLVIDRRSPIHSPYLYQQWLKRNGRTAAKVIAALDEAAMTAGSSDIRWG